MIPNHKGLDLIANTFQPLIEDTFHRSYGVVALNIAVKIPAAEIHEMLNVGLEESDVMLHSILNTHNGHNMSMHGNSEYWKKSAEQALFTGAAVGMEFLKTRSENFDMEFVKKFPNLIFSYAIAFDVICLQRIDNRFDFVMECVKPPSLLGSLKSFFKS